MTEIPKYALLEIERRWLVDLEAVGSLEGVPYWEIDDLYIEGTRMRLRRMAADSEVIYKLCKKYGKQSDLSQPITNLYLTESEYNALSGLPGIRVRKRRYRVAEGGLDTFPDSSPRTVLYEAEFPDVDSAMIYVPPPFVTREITGDASYEALSLARSSLS